MIAPMRWRRYGPWYQEAERSYWRGTRTPGVSTPPSAEITIRACFSLRPSPRPVDTARWDEIWESWRIEGLELRSSGDDKVLALFRMIAKGKGSGIELTREDAVLGELRGGKIVKVGYYNDQQ